MNRLPGPARSALLLLVLAATPPLPAQAPDTWVEGQVVYLRPRGCDCLDDAWAPGVAAGAWLSRHWGVGLDLLSARVRRKDDGASARETEGLASLYLNLDPDARSWFPYLKAGVGAAQVGSPLSLGPDTTVRPMYGAGGGVQHTFGAHGIVTLEARSVTLRTQVRRAEYQGVLGLGWRWGGHAATPPPAPVAEPAPQPIQETAPAPPPPAPAPLPELPQAAPPLAPPPPPAEPPPARPIRMVLDEAELHFANDRADLGPAGLKLLDRVAADLKDYPGAYSVLIVGHTSAPGTRAHNLALSRHRAATVARALEARGVPADHIRTAGMGPDQPVASNRTRAGQARNRRVEIHLRTRGAQTRRLEAPLVDPRTKVK